MGASLASPSITLCAELQTGPILSPHSQWVLPLWFWRSALGHGAPRTLLSSMTVLRDSIHMGVYVSIESTIHLGPS